MNEQSLSSTLKWCAEQLERHDLRLWNVVCNALDAGNPSWCRGTGKSAEDRAVIEIQRLYAVERTVKMALAPSSSERMNK
jgi:hypothetical protein